MTKLNSWCLCCIWGQIDCFLVRDRNATLDKLKVNGRIIADWGAFLFACAVHCQPYDTTVLQTDFLSDSLHEWVYVQSCVYHLIWLSVVKLLVSRHGFAKGHEKLGWRGSITAAFSFEPAVKSIWCLDIVTRKVLLCMLHCCRVCFAPQLECLAHQGWMVPVQQGQLVPGTVLYCWRHMLPGCQGYCACLLRADAT